MRLHKKKRASGLRIGDTYKYYKANVDKEKRLDKRQYYDTVKKFLKYMSDKLIDIGMVKIPASLGVLQIMGSDIKISIDKETGKIKGNVDWNSTVNLWKECEECKNKKQLVFYTNDDTGFKLFKTYWFNKTNRISNKSLYRFKASRPFKRRLAKHIKSGDYSYLYYHGGKK